MEGEKESKPVHHAQISGMDKYQNGGYILFTNRQPLNLR